MTSAKKKAARPAHALAMAFSLAGALLAPGVANAGSEGKLVITATVLKRATLQVLAQPRAVIVTAADIKRGYVDVQAPAQVAIQSNSANGYVLEFAPEGDFMRQIIVKGLDTDLQLNPGGGSVTKTPPGGATKTTLSLGFRFLLSASAQQGTYPWPVRLSVTPA